MKVDEDVALRAALAASSAAETTATMNSATTIARMISTIDSRGPLSAYGTAYRQALVDAFDTLNPQEPNPTPPPEVWEP